MNSQVTALRRETCGCLVAVLSTEHLARRVKSAFPRRYRVVKVPRGDAYVVVCRHFNNRKEPTNVA